jgi:hypothetical protein
LQLAEQFVPKGQNVLLQRADRLELAVPVIKKYGSFGKGDAAERLPFQIYYKEDEKWDEG